MREHSQVASNCQNSTNKRSMSAPSEVHIEYHHERSNERQCSMFQWGVSGGAEIQVYMFIFTVFTFASNYLEGPAKHKSEFFQY